MSSKWMLPKPLYEALPFLYPAVGLLGIAFLRNFAGLVCGGMLISAGYVIWTMRRNYRREMAYNQERFAERRAHFGAEADDGIVKLVWRTNYETGHESIDRQHRRLFSLGNELINATLTNKARGDIELLLDDLVEEIGRHFHTEEEMLEHANSPDSATHRVAHESLLTQVKALRQRFVYGQLSVGELVGFVAHDVIAQHVIKEDLKLPPPPPRSAAS